MAWLIANEPTLCPDRERATEVGQRLVELGVLHHVVQKSKPFLDGYFFYRFAKVTSPVRALVLISIVAQDVDVTREQTSTVIEDAEYPDILIPFLKDVSVVSFPSQGIQVQP